MEINEKNIEKINIKRKNIGVKGVSSFLNNKTNTAYINTNCKKSSKVYVFNLRLHTP